MAVSTFTQREYYVIKRLSILVALVGGILAVGAGTANAQVAPQDACDTGNATVDAACLLVAGQGWAGGGS
jgi:hypothetical protein